MFLALIAFFVGILNGATSIGGLLLIPPLIFLSGLDTHSAIATALFSFFFTGALSTWIFQKHGSLDWGMALPLCGACLVSGYLGASFGAGLSAVTLQLALAAVIILPSLLSLFPVFSTGLASSLGLRGRGLLLLCVGLFAGFICAMTGAGGGIVVLPLLLILGFPALPAIGTGQLVACAVSLSGSLGNFFHGFIHFPLAALLIVSGLAGALLGGRLAHILPVPVLKKGVTILCLVVGAYVAVRALYF